MNAQKSSGTVAVPVLRVFLVLELCAYRMTMRVGPIVEPCIVIFFCALSGTSKKETSTTSTEFCRNSAMRHVFTKSHY